MIRVSICIPAYNNADGIARLLASIAAQTFADYEVIISDDSRTRDVERAVRDAREKFPQCFPDDRFVYLRNEKPLGAVPNWNAALLHARGTYLKLMHHDDFFTDGDSLARFVSLLDEAPDAAMAFSGSMQVPLHGGKTGGKIAGKGTPRHISAEDRKALETDWRYLYLQNPVGAPSAVIVRREFVQREGISYDTALTWLVDAEYYMQILSRSPHFACTEAPLVSIGLSDAQLTRRVSEDDEIQIREYTHVFRKYDLGAAAGVGGNPYRERLTQVLAAHHAKASAIPEDLGIDREAFRLAEKKSARQTRKRRADTAAYLLDKCRTKLSRPAALLFYLGVLMEIAIVIVDKSDMPVPYQGQLFRLTFALFFAKLLCTKIPRGERPFLVLFLALGFVSYRITGRNEILRITVFVAAMRDMNTRRLLKTTLFVTAAGCILLFALSAAGIFGTRALIGDTSGHGVEIRYCYGFGHPNALHCMWTMLMSLGLYLYGRRTKHFSYVVMLIANLLLYLLTGSESGFLTGLLILFLCFILKMSPALGERKLFYFAGEAVFITALVFSLFAAAYGDLPAVRAIDGRFLTGRIGALWDTVYHQGTLATWSFFSSPANDYYFDMGWVRLVYWYGVIPAAAMLAVLFALLRVLRRKRDAYAFAFVLVLCLYTTLEAHLVSVYLLRNYIFFLIAANAAGIFGGELAESK